MTFNSAGDYTGPERRRLIPSAEDARLDLALAEIRRLHGAATELASVVARTVPPEEAAARESQFRWILVAVCAAVVFLLAFTLLFLLPKLLDRFDRLDHGQQVQQCLMTRPEAARTGFEADTAILACEREAQR